jgi:hypothetical protein
MTTPTLLRAPFPWFGGKALAADLVWERFGAVQNYIEPFFGSGAILLNAPAEIDFVATVNDIDAHVANFWRAVSANPDAVAANANHQVNEADLQARHQYLVDNRGVLAEKIKADPRYFDAELAGWWAWGASCWIGSGWCADRQIPHLGNKGQGVKRQIPHLGNKGQGVKRQIPHLGDKGQGVKRQIPHLGDKGQGDRGIFLSEWFERLSGKFTEARITCGDWKRICAVPTMLRFGVCGIVLDPPYGTTDEVYAHDSQSVAAEVQAWCIENGAHPKLRIALCGHVGQHEILESQGWLVESPKKNGGYQGTDDRERIWFSPACIAPSKKIEQLNLLEFAL